MKVAHVHIRNFKGIREFEWDLRDERGQPRSRAVLVGDNASGKTSVLQAIALALFKVVIGRDPRQFKWPGFQFGRIGTLGETRIDVTLSVSPAEIDAAAWTYEAHTGRSFQLRPDQLPDSIKVRFERGDSTITETAATFPIAARRYLADVMSGRTAPAPYRLRDLGGVFWFDQLRSAGLLRGGNGRTYDQGVAELREELTKWDNFHKSILLGQRSLQPGQRDLLKELEEAYALIFPGVSFVGVEPVGPNDADAYFVLQRNGVTYDLAESSSGEQAVLPILYEFVRQEIGNSVVLIDEIETHLHPPLSQALYNTLPKLGPDCQFLLTTHSEAVTSIVPEEEITRIPGGRLCL